MRHRDDNNYRAKEVTRERIINFNRINYLPCDAVLNVVIAREFSSCMTINRRKSYKNVQLEKKRISLNPQ